MKHLSLWKRSLVYLMSFLIMLPGYTGLSLFNASKASAANDDGYVNTVDASPVAQTTATLNGTNGDTVAETPTITSEPTTLEPTPTSTVATATAPIVTSEPTTTQSPSQWTFEKVELNKEYVAPQNSGVKLTFTKLPNPAGSIKIEEITLTPEQIQQTGSLSDKAYDITSDMANGSFSYNLSLPIPESSKGKAVDVKFAEELTNIGSAAKVENTLTKTDTSVSVTSLDHFTIFVVAVVSDPVCIGAGANCFQTIQAAIDAANPAGGDTINVAAGTYHEQVIIDKAVSVLGAGAATTFIDGTGVTPVQPGLVNITNETGAVTLDGFTIRNAAAGGMSISIWAKQADEGPVYSSSMTITHNILVGSGHLVPTDDYGLYSKYNKSNLVFSHNDVSNFGGNAFLFELHTGPAEISHNIITVDPGCGSTAFFSMSYKDGYNNNNDVTGKQWLHDNTINANGESAITMASAVGFGGYNDNTYGKYTNVEIADNVITNVGDAKKGIQLEVDGDNGGFVNPLITGNAISAKDPNPGPGQSRGIRIMGVVTGAQILDNVITGFYRGIYQSDSFSHLVYPTNTQISTNVITGGTYGIDIAGGTATIHLNSIVGNTLFGVNNQTVATIDATNNWWGNASGPYDNKTLPGTPNYNNPLGTGNSVTSYVDYKPWYTNAEMTTLSNQLPAPTNLIAAAGNGEVSLAWNAVAGAAYYNVSHKKSSDAGFGASVPVTNTTTKIIGLTNGVSYDFQIIAVNADGILGISAVTTASPVAPTIVKAVATIASRPVAPQAVAAPTPTVATPPTTTAPTDQGQIKGTETTAPTTEDSFNWTPWIILIIIIALAGAATGGYFYWTRGEEVAASAATVVVSKKSTPAKTPPKNGSAPKKTNRW